MTDQSPQSSQNSNELNATDAQIVYLDALTSQAGESAPDGDVSKTEATKIIQELRQETGVDDTTDTADDDIVSLHRDQ